MSAVGFGRLRAAALGLALLGAPAASGRSPARDDWSAVESIEAGRRIRVKLRADAAPRGERLIRGRFDSADADGIAVALRKGGTRTVAKEAVGRVAVRIPIGRRGRAWLPVAAAFGILSLYAVAGPYFDLTFLGKHVVLGGILVYPETLAVSLLIFSHRPVYIAPRGARP